MLMSMTGYGVAQGEIGNRRIAIEAKSVNHKFCEINLRIPSRYASLESKIVEFAKAYFKRGRIDIFVREENGNAKSVLPKIDLSKLQYYREELRKAAEFLALPNQTPTLETLLTLPQVITVEEEADLEAFWEKLLPILKASFESLEAMRRSEGMALSQFLQEELVAFEKEIEWIGATVPQSIAEHQKQLEERIQRLSGGVELDPQRLAQEVAYFVDRTDISEELQRFRQHVAHFRELLRLTTPLGRKLDFLIQEMNREVNTLSAKAQNALISQRVVECKHGLEKVREQVQNIE